MKFSGEAGFRLKDVEVEPDVFEPQLVTKIIKGNVVQNRYGRQNGDKSTIDNITITNQLSIVANQFLMKHIANLLYVKFQGVKWKVVSYNIKAPRIFVELGGVYNEQEDAYPGLHSESDSENGREL